MILKKQYESELNKFKVDGDLKIKEICDTYEKNIEKIVIFQKLLRRAKRKFEIFLIEK